MTRCRLHASRWLRLLACVAALAPCLPAAAGTESPELAVLAISALDGRAVVMEPGSAAALKSSGDTLLEGRYRIRSVRRDFVVVESADASARGGVEFWIHVAAADGKSEIRRVSRTPQSERQVREKRIVRAK